MSQKKKRFIKKKRKIKPWNKRKIPGDHRLRFYRDAKSGHPFMSISKCFDIHFGHEMTESPSLLQTGKPKSNYIRLRKNPNPNDKRRSYYQKSIKRLNNTKKGNKPRLSLRKKWSISNKDLKRLKNIDKKRIKNVRRADN